MGDQKQALYNADRQVNLSAQVILKYLANAEGLNAIEDWYNHRKGQGQGY